MQDYEKGFIMAEVMSYDDFKANGSSEASVRAAGKLRMEGRLYEVQDGDIIHVRRCSSVANRDEARLLTVCFMRAFF